METRGLRWNAVAPCEINRDDEIELQPALQEIDETQMLDPLRGGYRQVPDGLVCLLVLELELLLLPHNQLVHGQDCFSQEGVLAVFVVVPELQDNILV